MQFSGNTTSRLFTTKFSQPIHLIQLYLIPLFNYFLSSSLTPFFGTSYRATSSPTNTFCHAQIPLSGYKVCVQSFVSRHPINILTKSYEKNHARCHEMNTSNWRAHQSYNPLHTLQHLPEPTRAQRSDKARSELNERQPNIDGWIRQR